MIKNIAVFATFNYSNIYIIKALEDAGFNVSVMTRDITSAKGILPPNVNLVEGNLSYHHDLKFFLDTQDAVYCSFDTGAQDENDYQEETDGLREIINASLESGIRRIALHSSIIQKYQGENGFYWWAFKVKNEAVNYVRDCGIPFTILSTSSFMESLMNGHLKNKTIQIFGEAKFPIYYISVVDFGKMLVNSFSKLGTDDREYNIQGENCYTPIEAATIFVRNYNVEKLKIKTFTMACVKFKGIFNKRMNYNSNLMSAINNYSEIFCGEQAWKELGKPEIDLIKYANSFS